MEGWPASDDLRRGAASLGINLSKETLDRFAEFERDLYVQNESRNLTRVPREEAWERHFLDSLLLSPLLPHGALTLDIGTGPGFPAWPLALARPDLEVTALDSSGKMLAFLSRHPLVNLEIVLGRAEEWGRREAYDVVTGRAVAPLAIQLEISAAFVRVGGAAIPMRTPADDPLLPDASRLGFELESVARGAVTIAEAERAFPIYRKVGRTPSEFPRRWAEIRAAPLVRPPSARA